VVITKQCPKSRGRSAFFFANRITSDFYGVRVSKCVQAVVRIYLPTGLDRSCVCVFSLARLRSSRARARTFYLLYPSIFIREIFVYSGRVKPTTYTRTHGRRRRAGKQYRYLNGIVYDATRCRDRVYTCSRSLAAPRARHGVIITRRHE